ncbi:MAG: carboxyltransferase domain-containing protein [Enterocloster sp.]
MVLCCGYAVTVRLQLNLRMKYLIETNRKVIALKYRIEGEHVPGIRELVPSYRSLLIHYDPLKIPYNELERLVEEWTGDAGEIALPKPVITEIPVLYEGEDIGEIARIEKKTVDEIIRIHSQSDYFVYMLGFAPGHPYQPGLSTPFPSGGGRVKGTHSRGKRGGTAGAQRYYTL